MTTRTDDVMALARRVLDMPGKSHPGVWSERHVLAAEVLRLRAELDGANARADKLQAHIDATDQDAMQYKTLQSIYPFLPKSNCEPLAAHTIAGLFELAHARVAFGPGRFFAANVKRLLAHVAWQEKELDAARANHIDANTRNIEANDRADALAAQLAALLQAANNLIGYRQRVHATSFQLLLERLEKAESDLSLCRDLLIGANIEVGNDDPVSNGVSILTSIDRESRKFAELYLMLLVEMPELKARVPELTERIEQSILSINTERLVNSAVEQRAAAAEAQLAAIEREWSDEALRLQGVMNDLNERQRVEWARAEAAEARAARLQEQLEKAEAQAHERDVLIRLFVEWWMRDKSEYSDSESNTLYFNQSMAASKDLSDAMNAALAAPAQEGES